MHYQPIQAKHREILNDICGTQQVSSEQAWCEKYSHDETEDLRFLPELVVKPGTAEEVARVLAYCSEQRIPVTPSGARTGLSGGALPVYGGINLSVERLNAILEIDEHNLQATAEPGVINQVFHEACRQKGLFYPPDPSSWGSSFLGVTWP